MIFVSQRSDSVFVFLHASSRKFSDYVSNRPMYVVEQIIESQHILNNWKTVHVDSFELIGTDSVHSIYERIESS